MRFWTLLGRVLLLRCPSCGKGKLFRRWFSMYDRCPVCQYVYEREEGFYSGAMAINLIVSEFLVAAFILPVSVIAGMDPHVPFIPLLILASPFPILLPLLFFRHSRGLWLNMYYFLNPPEVE